MGRGQGCVCIDILGLRTWLIGRSIRFLCFCVLKCEIKNVQTANKRKGLDEGREETLTPKSKKAKSSTPASKEGGEDDEEAPEKSIEEGEEAEKTAEDKDKAGVQSGKKKDAETPKPKKKPGRPTKTGEPRERYQLGKETKVKEKAAALAKKVEDTAAHVTDHDLMNEDEPTDKSAESVSKKTAGEASVVDALVGVPIKSTETDTGAINVSPTMPASPAGQNSFATPTKLTGTDVRHGEITPSHTPGTREVRGDSGPMLLKFIVTSKGHEDSTVFSEWSNITIQHFLWQAQGNSIGGVRFGIMGALVAEMTIPNGEVISFSLIRRGNIDPQQSWQAAVDKAVKVIDSGSYAEGAEIRLCLS